MRILVVSNLNNISTNAINTISERNFCDFCVSIGNVSFNSIKTIRHYIQAPIYFINGLDGFDNCAKSINNNLAREHNKNIFGIDYNEKYQYWSEEIESQFFKQLPEHVDILFTYHVPKESIDVYGMLDKPDYAIQLVRKIKPKIHISGSEQSNYIGTIKEYKQPTVCCIYTNEMVLLEIDDECQIRMFQSIT